MEILVALAFVVLWLAFTLVAPIVAVVRLQRLSARVEAIEKRLAEAEGRAPATGRAPLATPAATETPVPAPEAGTAVAAVPAGEGAIPLPGTGPMAPPAVDHLTGPPPVEDLTGRPPVEHLTLPPVPAAPAPAAAATVSATASRSLNLERRIGSRWLLYLGLGAVLLGASYFIKYAIDNEWLGPAARTALGVVAGLAVAVTGQRQARRGLGFFGHALAGGGFGLVFLSLYAAYRLYGLVPAPAAFGLMAGASALAAFMADRERSGLLALVAVVGGFATPFLASSGQNAPVTLFTYLALLIAATLVLSRRHGWLWLHVVSYLATGFTWLVWADAYWTTADWLVTQVFLTVHAALFAASLRGLPRAGAWINRMPSAVLWSAPVVYHLASVINLDAFPAALLVYLTAVTLAGVVIAEQQAQPWLRAAVWVAVAWPLVAFPDAHPARALVLPTVVTMLAVHVLHLMAVLRSARPGWQGLDIGLLHANALWLVLALSEAVQPHAAWLVERSAWGLTLAYAALAVWGWRAASAAFPHLIFLTATLAAIALAVTLDGPWLTVAWAVEGAGLVRWGLGGDRPWFRRAGAALIVVAAVRLLGELGQPLAADAALVFNLRAASTALVVGLLAWLAREGIVRAPRTWRHSWPVAVLITGGAVIGVVWLTAEIHAAYGQRAWMLAYTAPAAALASPLAREATVSVTWAVYAFLLVAAGIRWRYAPVRYLGIAIFAIASTKVLLLDLSRLDRIYRILSVMGLGVLLVLASYLYQRLLDEGTADSAAANREVPSPAPGDARIDGLPAGSGGSAGGPIDGATTPRS